MASKELLKEYYRDDYTWMGDDDGHLSFSNFSVELKNIRPPGMKASGWNYRRGLENKKKPLRIKKD